MSIERSSTDEGLLPMPPDAQGYRLAHPVGSAPTTDESQVEPGEWLFHSVSTAAHDPDASYPTNVSAASKRPEIDALYPAYHESGAREFSTALRLLRSGIQHLQSALAAVSATENDLIRSDYEVTRFRGLLPELFCCRTIGKGFASVVVSIGAALENHAGELLDRAKIQLLLDVISCLRQGPFLGEERALDLIEGLERGGFDVDPEGLKILAEHLADD